MGETLTVPTVLVIKQEQSETKFYYQKTLKVGHPLRGVFSVEASARKSKNTLDNSNTHLQSSIALPGFK